MTVDVGKQIGRARAKRYRKAIKAFRKDPALFCKNMFDMDADDAQKAVMEAVARGDRGVAVKSGHGIGKTRTLAALAIWHITVFYHAKCAITAPSSGQLMDALLPEIKALIQMMPDDVQEWYNVKQDRIEFVAYPHLNFISAKTSRQENPDAMQGVHADHVLLIGDEASGIPDNVYESSAGSMSSDHACMLLAGNPVRSSGYFYDCFESLADSWTLFTISCVDSPRVSKQYIEEAKERYGEDSNAYRVRVLGEFPLGDDDTVIPVELIDSAVEREVEPFGPYVWGLDVARFGTDKTALAKRRTNAITEKVQWWAGLDTMQVAGRVYNEWLETPHQDRPELIVVDSIGYGAGVVDRLRELDLPVTGINVSETLALNPRYKDLNSELLYSVREWLAKRDVSMVKDARLRADLKVSTYGYTSAGKIKVSDKDAVRKVNKSGSPDLADAVKLTFCRAAIAALHGRRRPSGKRKRRKINVV